MNSYQRLANAIIKQAASDYVKLLAGLMVEDKDCNISDLENFFRSDFYKILTQVDGEYLMTLLKRKAAKLVVEYTVEKTDTGYYVCKTGTETVPLSKTYKIRRTALRKAAEMQGLEYRLYMRIRKRDGINDKD